MAILEKNCMKKTIALFVVCTLLILMAYAQVKQPVDKKVTIQANDEIVIKTGDASITMKKDGSIIIKGTNLQIEGSQTVHVKASGNVILKGNKIKDN